MNDRRNRAVRRLRTLPLPVLCLLAALALRLICGAGLWAFDAAGYAAGRLHTQTITLADTELYTLHQLEFAGEAGATLRSTEGDSQLLLSPGQPVRTLRLVAEYSSDGCEMDLYYHLPGRGYSQQLRCWPTRTAAGEYSYTVPFFAGQGLRLDLCDRSNVTVWVKAIVLNEPLPWHYYLVPSPWQLFWLAAGAGLAACMLSLCRELLPNRNKKTR